MAAHIKITDSKKSQIWDDWKLNPSSPLKLIAKKHSIDQSSVSNILSEKLEEIQKIIHTFDL